MAAKGIFVFVSLCLFAFAFGKPQGQVIILIMSIIVTVAWPKPLGKRPAVRCWPSNAKMQTSSNPGCDPIRETNYGADCIKLFISFGNKSHFVLFYAWKIRRSLSVIKILQTNSRSNLRKINDSFHSLVWWMVRQFNLVLSFILIVVASAVVVVVPFSVVYLYVRLIITSVHLAL